MNMDSTSYYTKKEEWANSLSHAAGICMGAIAGYILLATAFHNNNIWAVGSILVYLFGMLASYITSTCYHACSRKERKEIWRKFDHSAIYLHIAGTYVPFTLIVLRETGGWGWTLFTITWTAAIVGIFFSFTKLKKHSHLETICFVIMGCSILIAFKPLIDNLSANGQIEAFYWLVAGGMLYIAGSLFYSWTNRRFMHTVFHLFVLGGSFCHILSIYLIL